MNKHLCFAKHKKRTPTLAHTHFLPSGSPRYAIKHWPNHRIQTLWTLRGRPSPNIYWEQETINPPISFIPHGLHGHCRHWDDITSAVSTLNTVRPNDDTCTGGQTHSWARLAPQTNTGVYTVIYGLVWVAFCSVWRPFLTASGAILPFLCA